MSSGLLVLLVVWSPFLSLNFLACLCICFCACSCVPTALPSSTTCLTAWVARVQIQAGVVDDDFNSTNFWRAPIADDIDFDEIV